MPQVIVNYPPEGFNEIILPSLRKAVADLSSQFSIEYGELLGSREAGYELISVTITSAPGILDFGDFWEVYDIHKSKLRQELASPLSKKLT